MIPLAIKLPDLPNGACREADPDLFFPGDGVRASDADINEAKYVCSQCPEVVRCLEWALQNDEQGVWGATTDEERRSARRKGKQVVVRTPEQRRREVSALHAEGLGDGDIARRLKVSRSVVHNDRGALGLACNIDALEPRREAVAILHARGLNDREIASQLNVSRDQVRNDRVQLGLGNNYGRKETVA